MSLSVESSFVDVVQTINQLLQNDKNQREEIERLKTEELKLKEIIKQQNGDIRDLINNVEKNMKENFAKARVHLQNLDSQTLVMQESICDLKRCVADDVNLLKSEDDANASKLDDLSQSVADIETRLAGEIEDMTALSAEFAKSEDVQESARETSDKLGEIQESMESEIRSVNRKFGIFQKQEKYLLDMLTNVQTEVCGLSDSLNSMEYRKTVSEIGERLSTVEVKSKQVKIVLKEAKQDLGHEINEAFKRNKDLQYLEIVLADLQYKWDEPVDLPTHTFLKISARESRNGYICKKRRRDGADECDAEDVSRCPVKIIMKDTRTVENDEFSHIYFRLRLNSYSKFELNGVTIEENMPDLDGPIFTPGIFLLSGSYSAFYLTNSRVSFTTDTFINSTGCGEKHMNLAHTRFLRARGNSFHDQSVVGCHRGKAGYLGRRLIVSGTDVVCEMGIRQTTDDDNIEYLC